MNTTRGYVLFTGFALGIIWACAWLIRLDKSRDVFVFYGVAMTLVLYLLPLTVVVFKAIQKWLRQK